MNLKFNLLIFQITVTSMFFGQTIVFAADNYADINRKTVSIHSESSVDSSRMSSPETTLPLNGSLKQIQGTVLINHGKGYSVARLDMGLSESDRVLTMDRASAVVVQDNGCIIRITENSIFTLQRPGICGSNEKSVKKVGPFYARAIGSEAITDVPPNIPDEIIEQQETIPEKLPESVDIVEPTGSAEIIEEVVADSGGSSSWFSNLSTTQTVVTGVAVGLGLAVASSSGGGSDGAVSGQ